MSRESDAPKTFDVVAFGAANVDTIARLSGPAVAASVPGCTRSHAGGAAFNAARHVASAGFSVALATPATAVAEWLIREAAQTAGVELFSLRAPAERVPSYTAILDVGGELVSACADMAAYDAVTPTAVDRLLDRLTLLQERAPTFTIVDANLPVPVLERIVERLDPDTRVAALAVSPSKAPRLRSIAHRIDILFASGGEGPDMLNSDDARFRCAVVTNGSDDIVVIEEGVTSRLAVDRREGVDVTGAGDALAGATIARLVRGEPLLQAVSRARDVAAHAIMHEGPFTPFPSAFADAEAAPGAS